MTSDAVTGRLLTARQVAELIGVSTETVLRWTRRGELPAIRLPGGALRYREADLDDWLSRRATAPATLPVMVPATLGGTT
jgi:excisionase family DNA binding protein